MDLLASTERAIFKGKFAALANRSESIDIFCLIRGHPDFSLLRMILQYYQQIKTMERVIGYHFPIPGSPNPSLAWLVGAKTL